MGVIIDFFQVLWKLPVLIKSRRLLRSNSLKYMLDTPMTNRVTYGDRAFLVHASKLWNKLPSELKNIKDTNKFKKKLKTHLYKMVMDR